MLVKEILYMAIYLKKKINNNYSYEKIKKNPIQIHIIIFKTKKYLKNNK